MQIGITLLWPTRSLRRDRTNRPATWNHTGPKVSRFTTNFYTNQNISILEHFQNWKRHWDCTISKLVTSWYSWKGLFTCLFHQPPPPNFFFLLWWDWTVFKTTQLTKMCNFSVFCRVTVSKTIELQTAVTLSAKYNLFDGNYYCSATRPPLWWQIIYDKQSVSTRIK